MTATAGVELLPCPFCGDDGEKGAMEVTHMSEPRTYTRRITCRVCGAQAVDTVWNRRWSPPAAQGDEAAVERAAIAMHERAQIGPWNATTEGLRDTFRQDARAALLAAGAGSGD